MSDYDVAIIGAGPAGLTAGIYAARYGLKTVIIEKGLIGGTAAWANSIHNYPGYTNISGMELTAKFHEQAQKEGAETILDTVHEVKDKGREKEIILSEKKITAKALIIAVGSKSKWIGAKGEKEFLNKGVHFCATCDGPMYNGKEVAVIGSDHRAAEEAIYLAGVTKKVYLISPKKELTAEAAQLNTLKEKKVEVLLETNVIAFEGSQMLEKIIVKQKGKETKLNINGAFIYVGAEPNTQLFNVKKDTEGRVITNENMETNLKGIFACGDCIKKELKQIATCVGEGAIAAHTAAKYVQGKELD
jgi:thioredoxin reductase (NADPH)